MKSRHLVSKTLLFSVAKINNLHESRLLINIVTRINMQSHNLCIFHMPNKNADASLQIQFADITNKICHFADKSQ